MRLCQHSVDYPAVERLATLRTCDHRPSVLDDHTLNRFVVLRTEQCVDQWLYEQQFARWKRGALSDLQAREVNRLIEQSVKLKAINEKILVLSENSHQFDFEERAFVFDALPEHNEISKGSAYFQDFLGRCRCGQ